MLKCSECSKNLIPTTIKYHTADRQHVFCDAYCSHDWHMKHKDPTEPEPPKAGDTITF